MKKTEQDFTEDDIVHLKMLLDVGESMEYIVDFLDTTEDVVNSLRVKRGLDNNRNTFKFKCIICGNICYSNVKNAKTCKMEHHRVCAVCGKDFIVDRYNIKDTCSAKCSSIKKYGVDHPGKAKEVIAKRQVTVKEKYGVDNISQLPDHNEKSKKTCLEKYGAESYAGSVEGRAKTRATNLERYGYAEPFGDKKRRAELDSIIEDKYGTKFATQTDSVKKKTKKTNLDRYGVENPMQSEEIKERFKKNAYNRYGVYSYMQLPEVKEKLSKTVQEKYGVPWACMRPEAFNYNKFSKVNRAFAELLTSYDIDYTIEFPVGHFSFDFKIGQILVEIDPTITHNSFMSIYPQVDPTDRFYHKNKTDLAIKNGYRCIHIFDWDDWNNIVKLLSIRDKIYARQCIVELVPKEIAEEFTGKHHIQGSCRGQEYNIGLFYNGELVQLMTFGKPRYNKKFDFELLRLCSIDGKEVVGGPSRLFKHFIKENSDSTIISYCDLAKFSGNVYEKIGMKLDYISDPAKIWSKNEKRITDNLLRQRGYDQLFNAYYGKGTSNEELMLESGWLPVYDCGQKVFVYEPKEVN